MREIFPENNYTEIVGRDSDIVKKEDILPITEQLNQTKQALEILQSQFESYQTEISESVNTSVINSITAAIQTIDATLANIDNAEVDNLTVNTRATLTTLSAQIASITSALTAPEATINELSSLDIQAVNGAIQTLQSESATFDTITTTNYNVDNVNANTKITSPSAEITEIDSSSISTNSLSTGDIAATGDMNIEGNIASLGEISAPEISVENIVWKGAVALSNTEDFYIEVPHFENGQYYVQLQDNNVPYVTIEIFNSVDNYMVRWSQSELNQLENVYKYGSGTSSQLYFKIKNLTGNALTMKYATESITANVQGPETYTTLPIEPDVTYDVAYQNGTKLFSNIDLARDGGTAGVLAHRTSDLYELNTDTWNYDGTNNVNETTYKPDQSLNTYDNVHFRTVDSTFLDVADLEIAGQFKGKHIYDGAQVADESLLNDDSIYIKQPITSGTITDGARMSLGDGNGNYSVVRDWSASFTNAFNQNTYENTTYRPQDGYTLGTPIVTAEETRFILIANEQHPDYSVCMRWESHQLKTYDTGNITCTGGAINLGPNSSYSFQMENGTIYRENIILHVGDRLKLERSGQWFVVVFPSLLKLEATSSIPYTRLDPASPASINRKTTKNNATQVLPIIPYEEISTQQTPVDNTHPVVYDNSTDTLKKSTGDITIDGDLDVGGDTSITGDTSVGGDVTITGDISADNATFTGDLTADGLNISENLTVSGNTTIHGDLWVSGTTHTTKEESVSTTGDVVVLRQNNNTSLGATYAGMLINKYDGNSDLALVTDSDGTLRVGTGTGADTVYSNLYWDNDTEKWYSDSALTTEVSPTGTLTSWDTLEEIGDVLHYTNAVFTVINFTGLVPLLARDESTNMNADGFLQWDSTNLIAKAKSVSGLTNGALLKWNSTTKMFENIGTTPAANEFLSYTGTAYDWATPPKAYVFATMAEYNAAASSVPDGSVVYITSLPNYLRANI